MSDTKREWTEDEVEWAARCLQGPDMRQYPVSPWWQKRALHALAHGYVPPPRPKSVREQVREVLDCVTSYEAVTFYDGSSTTRRTWQDIFLDALLARFDVTPKGVA